MNIQGFVEQMKSIENEILVFLDKEYDLDESFENIIFRLNNIKNRHDFKTFLYLLSSILNNHHRNPTFINKMEKILLKIKLQIREYFSFNEIYKFFEKCPRFLLFLFQENIIMIDEDILGIINMTNFIYLFPKKALEMKLIDSIPENYEEKQLIGENDSLISELIRKDSIGEFISYVNKNYYSLYSKIEYSIFETNTFLIKRQNQTTLIEYAAFFGSTQIFKYLYKNGIDLTPLLWLYAIHSDNPEIINLLEENQVKPPNNSYEKCIKESIKCHHIDITNYIRSNLIVNNDVNIDNIYLYCFHYYNFFFFQNEIQIDKINFFYACKYDYYQIVEYFMKTIDIDINEKIIKI